MDEWVSNVLVGVIALLFVVGIMAWISFPRKCAATTRLSVASESGGATSQQQVCLSTHHVTLGLPGICLANGDCSTDPVPATVPDFSMMRATA